MRLRRFNEADSLLKEIESLPIFPLWRGEAYFSGLIGTVNYDIAFHEFSKVAMTDYDDEKNTNSTTIIDTHDWYEDWFKFYPQHYGDACYRLYECYLDGKGTKKDSKMADMYFRTALKFGSKSAMYDDQMRYEKENR